MFKTLFLILAHWRLNMPKLVNNNDSSKDLNSDEWDYNFEEMVSMGVFPIEMLEDYYKSISPP